MDPNTASSPVKPEVPTPVNPVINPAAPVNEISATDPITMPTPVKAPDPIEEELKAPLRAADPVPGSIGSAISVPPKSGTIGAASAPTIQMQATANPAKKAKKQTSKNTWVLVAVLAVIVVVALVVVLMMLLGPTK